MKGGVKKMVEYKLKVGDKYLTLQIGNLKIPFFAAKTKEGKKYYRTNVRIWVNEKKQEEPNKDSEEEI